MERDYKLKCTSLVVASSQNGYEYKNVFFRFVSHERVPSALQLILNSKFWTMCIFYCLKAIFNYYFKEQKAKIE